ncbi:unnamed protein product, partial [marine sediment metagenome]
MDVLEQVKELVEPPRSPPPPGLKFSHDQTKVPGKSSANGPDRLDYPPRVVQNSSRWMEQVDGGELKRVFDHLSPRSQQILLTLAQQLAESEGISISPGHPPAVADLSAAIPLWEDDLSSREYSDRTIETYSYWVKRILAAVPEPTYLNLIHYLAEQRKRDLAANTRKMMTKGLKSFFN